MTSKDSGINQCSMKYKWNTRICGNKGKFHFFCCGREGLFYPYLWCSSELEEEGGGSGTFLQGEPGTGAVPRTFLVVTSPGTAALNPTAQLVPQNFIYWTM